MNIIKSLFSAYLWQVIKELLGLGMFVTLDPRDNSVTLSHRLFAHMQAGAKEGEAARVFVFKRPVPSDSFGGVYAFCVNPDIEQPTQYCDIQFNGKYGTVGFETLCPSVGQIAYVYRLPYDKPSRLSVRYVKQTVPGGSVAGYYELIPPRHEHRTE